MQRIRTHRCLSINNAIENSKVIVPELIYWSKYTPTTITTLLQHAETRVEKHNADMVGNQKRYSPQYKHISILRKSDYTSPITIPSAPSHQSSLLPSIGRLSAKPSTSTNTHISKASSELTRDEPIGHATSPMHQSPGSGHVIQLKFTPDMKNNLPSRSPVRRSPGSPIMKSCKHSIGTTLDSTIKSCSGDQLAYKTDHNDPLNITLSTPAPSRVQSRLQTTNTTINTVSENTTSLKHKRTIKSLEADPAFSIRSIVNDLLALPTPQIHCTSPSFRMRFLDNNQ